ncbi:MAG: hypothetical protein NXI31_01840 [bacterium]|nr:hypothetical protein [bacterium]
MPATRSRFVAVLLLPLAGCFTPPPTPRPPLGVEIGYEPGSAVFVDDSRTGKDGKPAAAGPHTGDTRALHVTVRACQDRPSVPLDTVLDAVLATRGQPFRAGSPGLRGLALATDDTESAAPPDATAAATIAADFVTTIRILEADWPLLLVQRTATGVRLVIRQNAPPTVESPAAEAAGAGERTSTLARLQPFDLAPGERLTLLQREPGGARHVAVELQLGDPADPDRISAVQAELASRATAASEPASAPPPTALARNSVGARPRRGALLALAANFNLPRCLDLLLCLEEAELIAISDSLPADPDSGWLVERAFLAALLPRLQRGELPPPVVLCLRRHLGALALDPTGLEFALAASKSTAELSDNVVASNRRALSARRASQRALAHEWLSALDLAVPDYDPMAPRSARKAALAAAHRRAR